MSEAPKRSRHTGRYWRDYWAQVQRWHKRLDKIETIAYLDGKAAALDYIDAFFLTCYHLKDWVEKSGHPKGNQVKSFIDTHAEMKLCRELCHASKHFERDTSSNVSTATVQTYINGVRQPMPGESWVVIETTAANGRCSS